MYLINVLGWKGLECLAHDVKIFIMKTNNALNGVIKNLTKLAQQTRFR